MKKLNLTLVLFLLWSGFSFGQVQPTFNYVKTIGGIGNDGAHKLAFDRNGNKIIIGFFNNTVDFDPGSGVFNLTSSGAEDMFILKLDNNSNFIWAKKIGGTGSDILSNVAVNNLNEIILTGYFQNTVDLDPGSGSFNLTAAGQQDFFVEKLDSNGNFIFCKSVSGPFSDIISGLALDSDNNIYSTGWFTGSSTDFDPGASNFNLSASGADVFIWKLDVNGNFVWAKKVGGIADDTSSDIELDNNGNIIISGIFNNTVDFDPNVGVFNLTSLGQGDAFILKLSNNGNFLWAKSIGGNGSDVALGLDSDLYGNIIITGTYTGTVDFDPSTSVFNQTSNGLLDAFILKLNTSGNFIWAGSIGGTLDDRGCDVFVNSNNGFYFVGFFQGSTDLNPGASISNYNSNGSKDIFLSHIDSTGNLSWVKTIGGTGEEFSVFMTENSGKIYVTGFYNNIVDFDPDSGVQNSTSQGNSDAFILVLNSNICTQTIYNYITIYDTIVVNDTITYIVYDTITTTVYDTLTTSISVTDTLIINANITGVNPPNNTNTISVYPNPASTHITIDNGNFALMNGYTVRINNALGQTVFSQQVNQQQFYIDLSTWTGSGMYYLDLIDNLGNTIASKVIVIQ